MVRSSFAAISLVFVFYVCPHLVSSSIGGKSPKGASIKPSKNQIKSERRDRERETRQKQRQTQNIKEKKQARALLVLVLAAGLEEGGKEVGTFGDAILIVLIPELLHHLLVCSLHLELSTPPRCHHGHHQPIEWAIRRGGGKTNRVKGDPRSSLRQSTIEAESLLQLDNVGAIPSVMPLFATFFAANMLAAFMSVVHLHFTLNYLVNRAVASVFFKVFDDRGGSRLGSLKGQIAGCNSSFDLRVKWLQQK